MAKNGSGRKGADTTVWLLPEGEWSSPGAQGAVPFHNQKAFENLVRVDRLDARGVSDPWSAALGFEWRLQLQDPAADALLWLLLLTRYFGLSDVRTLTVERDASLLQEVLIDASRLDGIAQIKLTLFEWREPLRGHPRILAGAVWPRWTIFPSAHYQTTDAAAVVRDRLLEHQDDLLEAAGPSVTFTDEDEDRAFRAQLAALAMRDTQVASDGPWRGRLLALARRAKPAAVGETPGLVHTWFRDRLNAVEWQCPAHGDLPWSRDPAVTEIVVARNSGELRCAVHKQTSLKRGDRVLHVEDLGAAYLKDELIVWRDARRDPNLVLLPASGDQVSLRYADGPTFTARARLLQLGDVLCPPAVLRAAGSASPGYDVALPLRVRYLDLLQRYAWNPEQRHWTVTLRGRGTDEVLNRPAAGEAGTDTGFIVWPAERPEGWRSDVVVARHQFADELTLIERLSDDSRVPTAARRNAVLLAEAQHGLAEFVALRERQEERGVVPLLVPDFAEGQRGITGYIAVDFGTSNTLIQIAIGPRDGEFVAQGVTSIAEACSIAAQGKDFAPALSESLDIFHGTYQVKQPSALLGTLLLRKRPPESNSTQWSVIPRDPALVRSYRRVAGTELLTNLKWQELVGFDEQALEAYLQRVLLPAFYDLRRRGVASVHVAVTYPLAFESPRRAKLANAMETAIANLAERTGIAAPREQMRIISESHAGVQAIPAAGADYALTLDMGGGTTDIALMDRDQKVIVADSLQLGARRLLALLAAGQKNLDSELAQSMHADVSALVDARETVIETLLQAGGVKKLKQFIMPDGGLTRRRAIAALLAGIVVVTRRLLHYAILPRPHEGTPSVNVFLLGQGWGLLDAELTYGFGEESFISGLTKACGGKLTIEPQRVVTSSFDRKKLVVDGALALLRRDAPSTDQVPVSYIGMDLRLERDGKVYEIKGSERIGGEIGRLAKGDPGFDALIDELLQVMPTTTSAEFPLVDSDTWLAGREKPGSKPYRQQLIDKAWHELQTTRGEHAARVRSPLVSFVSRVWTPFWQESLKGPN